MPSQRRFKRPFAWVLAGVAIAVASPAFAGVAAPTITLTDGALNSDLNVGDTTTITVSAVITNAASTDGITEFDLDLFPLFKTGIDFSSVATLDPSAILVSPGTIDPATGGLLGISGIYSSTGKAVGSVVNLFTVQVHADAPGANSVSAGLSVYPNGVGIPFILNNSGDYVDPSSNGNPPFLVNSSGAIAQLTVSAAPEPSTALLALGLLAPALLMRRRTRS